MRVWLALSLVLQAPLIAGAAEPRFESLAIFPTEAKHNHASCVTELANGDLFAVWYTGTGERRSDDVKIQGAWRKRGDALWGPRFTVADTPGYPDCNPAIFAPPDGSIWLFWPTILDHRWEGALLKFARARDDGRHEGAPAWDREGVLHVTPTDFAGAMSRALAAQTEPVPEKDRAELSTLIERSRDELYQRLGWMPRVRPLVLPSGRWLLPLYSDTFSASLAALSDDNGATWVTGGPMIGFGNIQPSFVRKRDGTLVAYMRENGSRQKIRVSTSRDEGMSWGPVVDSSLPNPGTGVDAIALANGHWAIVYNDTVGGRHSLAISISEDEGENWKWTRHVERGAPGLGAFHYPSLLQTRDGFLHVTYTHGGTPAGSTIQHARFNEEWVTAPGAGR